MNTKRTLAATVTMVLFALGVMTVAASGEEGGWVAAKEVPAAAQIAGPVATVLDDKASDVANPKLDIRKVKVVNTATRLKVKVFFPGVAEDVRLPPRCGQRLPGHRCPPCRAGVRALHGLLQ